MSANQSNRRVSNSAVLQQNLPVIVPFLLANVSSLLTHARALVYAQLRWLHQFIMKNMT